MSLFRVLEAHSKELKFFSFLGSERERERKSEKERKRESQKDPLSDRVIRCLLKPQRQRIERERERVQWFGPLITITK